MHIDLNSLTNPSLLKVTRYAIQLLFQNNNHHKAFFVLHDFEYDSSMPATDKFHQMGWVWDKGDHEEAREGFKDALVQEFNQMYGTDVNDWVMAEPMSRCITPTISR
jgi:hypothetical protein